MDEHINSILDRWLEIEYYHTAQKAKFISKTVEADYKLVMATIRCLDDLTTTDNESRKDFMITVIALMWEHIDKSKYDIKNFVLKILTRIGYPTSAIIIDNEFSSSGNKFFRPDSIIDMLTLTLQQQRTEVSINEHSFLLTDFQKSIWDAMDTQRVIGISAPTSAGKSFVLLIKTISRLIVDKLDIVYIVPTLSLLNQVTEDYNKMLKKLGVESYKIVNSFIPDQTTDLPTIYILTQEKALGAFSNEDTAFTKKLILVADEIQNIERIQYSSDLRAKILYDTLIEFRQKDNIEQVIISGPRINNIDDLGAKIFGNSTVELQTSVSPVLNLTYSIKKENDQYFFKQYCALRQGPFSRSIVNSSFISGYGKKLYTDEYMGYLNTFIHNVGSDNQNIIFAPTSNTAKNIAVAISDECEKPAGVIGDLIDYYAETINQNYAMCATLKSGVGYHHSKLPMHVRRTLEKAIGEKNIKNIVCTTTLMQGVNMPAQNVIVRNPHLYVKKTGESSELSSYEMSNLRGRAGRLLKDFVGRTFVLDESGFDGLEEYDRMDLFEDTTLEIPAGYGEKYEEYRNAIHDAIDNNISVDADMQKYGYLVSYIRQTVLRYGKTATEKMEQVGISLTKEQVAAIIYKLDSISVPKDVCYKNRYWDPLVINTIYNQLNIKELPNVPTDRGAKARLDDMLKFLRDNKATNSMYTRYIPDKHQRGSGRSMLCTACMNWSCETPLSDILAGDKYNGENATELIDDTIELLQKYVSFNVPLLLKPIFDMFKPESTFLLCMRTGAYKPFTRRMIEIGIPRETAIYLNSKLFKKREVTINTPDNLENEIRDTIKKNYTKLPYWIRVQLDFMV